MAGGVPSDIEGAILDSLCIPAELVGTTVELKVTKTNAINSTSAISLPTAIVQASLDTCPDAVQEYQDDRTYCQVAGCSASNDGEGNKIVEVKDLDADGDSDENTGNKVDIKVITEEADSQGPIEHVLTLRNAGGDELAVTRLRSELPGASTEVVPDDDNRPRVLTRVTSNSGVEYEISALHDGSAIHRVAPPGVEPSVVVSRIPGAQTLLSSDGQVTTVVEVPPQAGVRIRAHVITEPDGEGFTQYERYNDQSGRWENLSSTLNPISRFEPGHEASVEDTGDGLSMRIRFRVTRDIYF